MKHPHWTRWLAFTTLLLLLFGLAPWRAQAAVGFRISGRNIVDANGNNFIIRGISHAHTWYPSQTSSFANIKATGANTVRVVLSGGRWTKNSASDVANVIQLCKTNRLICVLENHDTTGYGEQSGAYTMAQAVTYWKEIQSVLTGQEGYVIINIGNEPYGNTNNAAWVTDTKNAIAAMRAAGFQHLLMVDAPAWGQDWTNTMRTNAASIFASDPNRNTVFSVHMYGVYDTAAEITSYVSDFVNAGLPLVIGEFGYNHSDGNPDEDTIMATSQTQGIGYMGWSWSGNGGGVEYLDMVTNFNPSQLTTWGERIINGANGIRQTSREAPIYGGPQPTPTRTPTSGPQPTPTRTPTPGPQPTPTPTPGTGTCSPVTSTVTAPFVYDGAGTFCWRTSSLGSYVNSWNLASLKINGVDYTNRWSNSFPAAIGGYYYISYSGQYGWSHFETR
jgi:mannan endo-1,4-beta-mannosidase